MNSKRERDSERETEREKWEQEQELHLNKVCAYEKRFTGCIKSRF